MGCGRLIYWYKVNVIKDLVLYGISNLISNDNFYYNDKNASHYSYSNKHTGNLYSTLL